MLGSRIEEIKRLLDEEKKVYVRDLSHRFDVSEVSIRKYLARLEKDGIVSRFHGGAELVEPESADGDGDIYANPLRNALARAAVTYVSDGDSIFVGSGRSCCVLARELEGPANLTVFTNNITALPDLIQNAARVYLIGGEVTSTDNQTLFSSWGSSQSQLENVFVNKAFTSVSGVDFKAGLTVDSIISTPVFTHITKMAHQWYLMVDSSKFDKISIYPVADLAQVHTLITDSIPPHYDGLLQNTTVRIVQRGGME